MNSSFVACGIQQSLAERATRILTTVEDMDLTSGVGPDQMNVIMQLNEVSGGEGLETGR